MWTVTRGGIVKAQFDTESEAWGYLHRIQGQSNVKLKVESRDCFNHSEFFKWLGDGDSKKGSKMYRRASFQKQGNWRKFFERIHPRLASRREK